MNQGLIQVKEQQLIEPWLLELELNLSVLRHGIVVYLLNDILDHPYLLEYITCQLLVPLDREPLLKDLIECFLDHGEALRRVLSNAIRLLHSPSRLALLNAVDSV